jgi:TonB family protein
LGWRGLVAEFRQRPLWEGAAGSLALHLLVASLLLCSPPGPEALVRLPIRQTILVDLLREPPQLRQARRLVAVEPSGAGLALAPASLPARVREETVSLAKGGKYERYLRQIKRKIEQGWVLAADIGEGDLIVVFSVERSGKLSRVKLLRSSGNRRLDASALSAVRAAGPFAPMPPQMALARLHVRASFCYRLASR